MPRGGLIYELVGIFLFFGFFCPFVVFPDSLFTVAILEVMLIWLVERQDANSGMVAVLCSGAAGNK